MLPHEQSRFSIVIIFANVSNYDSVLLKIITVIVMIIEPFDVNIPSIQMYPASLPCFLDSTLKAEEDIIVAIAGEIQKRVSKGQRLRNFLHTLF